LLETCSSHASLVQLELNYISVNGDWVMGDVPAELLARAAGNLQKVGLGRLSLTTDQCIGVLEACISSSKLEELTYTSWLGVDLAGVPSSLLGRAAANLKKLSLNTAGILSNIDIEQCKAILEACAARPYLVDLTLEVVDLKDVPVDLFKRAGKHLHSLNLRGCKLKGEQLVALLETCIAVPTLVELSLARVDLTEVPGDLFARVGGHLSKMILD